MFETLYVFPPLIVAMMCAVFYFEYKEKNSAKLEELSSALDAELKNRLKLEKKYNELLEAMTQQENNRRNNTLDTVQLLFAKVNMIDDKLTFLNDSIETKIDGAVFSLLHGVRMSETQRGHDETSSNLPPPDEDITVCYVAVDNDELNSAIRGMNEFEDKIVNDEKPHKSKKKSLDKKAETFSIEDGIKKVKAKLKEPKEDN